jgi:hypothetical protein
MMVFMILMELRWMWRDGDGWLAYGSFAAGVAVVLLVELASGQRRRYKHTFNGNPLFEFQMEIMRFFCKKLLILLKVNVPSDRQPPPPPNNHHPHHQPSITNTLLPPHSSPGTSNLSRNQRGHIFFLPFLFQILPW